MTHQRISDTSVAEIEETLAELRSRKTILRDMPCKWCNEIFRQKRHWQKFCSNAHLVLWHQNEKELYIEKLEGLVACLERDKFELQADLIQAKKEKPPT
jgi:uncharacterized C2H2 Zn-finger protein